MSVVTIVQRVRSGEERNSQGDRVPEEVGCHRQRRIFNTNLDFYSVYIVHNLVLVIKMQIHMFGISLTCQPRGLKM